MPVPFTIPARQTGRADFPHPAFRLASYADSRTRAHWPLEPYHAQRAEHPFLRELAGTLRRYLVSPSQKVPHAIIDLSIHRPVRLRGSPTVEVCSPASQFPIQPLADFFPWSHVARDQQVAHFLLDPGHALHRRTVSDVLPSRSHTIVRPEGIAQKIKVFPTGIAETRLLFVQGQLQSL